MQNVWNLFLHRLKRVWYGLDTPSEFILLIIDHIFLRFFNINLSLRLGMVVKRVAYRYKKDNFYLIGDVKIPLLSKKIEQEFFGYVFEDTFYFYVEHEKCQKNLDKYHDLLMEGPYEFRKDGIDVKISPGDIVFDLGSWIGDFAAYASMRGAEVYAFEPLAENFHILEQTARLNANIIPVQQGLGAKEGEGILAARNYTLNSVVVEDADSMGLNTEGVKITTIDGFVKERKIERVNFIKADIEGYERYMLMGAQDTLKRFSPKLALCTYHLPDDPDVLAALIKKANPAYQIIQKRKKLYAFVPGSALCI